jgi:Uncharacterized alpha/beta hydrolase domain (DUF2235)
MNDRDDVTCRIAREKSLHQAGIGTCSLALQIGFFFDGNQRSIYKDEENQRLTNVGRLFRAHPEKILAELTSSYSYSKFYIPGLGTPLDDSTAERLDSILDARQQALTGDYIDELVGQVKETAVDAIKGKGDWSKVLTNKLGDLLTLKSSFDASCSTVINAVKRGAVEAVAPVRDNWFVADLLMTGVDARVDYAKNKFKLNIEDVKKANQLPIKLIQVSVFGADLGATLARRFIEELLESICTKSGEEYRYEESKVEIIFAGLFDCSRRGRLDQGDGVSMLADATGTVFKAAAPATSLLGAKVIDYDKPLHPAVKKALHLVAAHERRVYRPLLPLGPLKSDWSELLCPGISEDVTGGLLPNEQRPSAELCRVPLRKMYDNARAAQVPFPNFSTLNKKDPYVASYFIMRDSLAGYSVEHFSDGYMKSVTAKYPYGKAPSSEGFQVHLYAYADWLGEKYQEYLALKRDAGQWDFTKRSQIDEQWGWLAQVKAEADQFLRTHSNALGGYDGSAGMRGSIIYKAAIRVVHRNIEDGSQKTSPLIAAFFNYFMHDFTADDIKRATLSQHLGHFFVPRGIEAIDEVVADSNENRWKIPPRGIGTPVDIRTGLIEKKVDTVSYVPIGNALSKINNGFMSGVLLDGAMLSGDKCMFSIAENTLNDASKFYSLELTNQRERVNAGARKYAEYAFWAPQGGFVDIPVHPRNGEPNYVFTPDFSGCCLVVDKINDTTLRVRHVEGGKEEVQYNTLQASEIGNGMVGHMLYDDYGIINGSENRCGFAFMVYSGGRWVIKWQANVGTMKLVKKKATGLFSKTECETALVTIPPEIFATGSRAIEV